MKTFFKIAFWIISVCAVSVLIHGAASIISRLIVECILPAHPVADIRISASYGHLAEMLSFFMDFPVFYLLGIVFLPWAPRAVSDLFGDAPTAFALHISSSLLVAVSPMLFGSFTMAARVLYVAGSVNNEANWRIADLPIVLYPFFLGVCYSIACCLLVFFFLRRRQACVTAEKVPSGTPYQNHKNQAARPILPISDLPKGLRSGCVNFELDLFEMELDAQNLERARKAIEPVLDYYKEAEKELPAEIRYRIRALSAQQTAAKIAKLPKELQHHYVEFETAVDTGNLEQARKAIDPVLRYWQSRGNLSLEDCWQQEGFPTEIRNRIHALYTLETAAGNRG